MVNAKRRKREGLRRGVRVSWLALLILARSAPVASGREVHELLQQRLRITERQVRNILALLLEQGLLRRAPDGYAITAEGFALAERLLSPPGRWLVEVEGDRVVADYATAALIFKRALRAGVKRAALKRL